MKRILHVVGARPNYMKIAPLVREMAKYTSDFAQMLVHTGQHYDDNMSQIFFHELEMPRPISISKWDPAHTPSKPPR